MIHPGLVSITFRQLLPEEILTLVTKAELEAIEWGGDVHVPHGNVEAARRIGEMTTRYGLIVSSYGSYYRVGHPESATNLDEKPVPFAGIVETAVALGAPKIRVWAGIQGTDKASPTYWNQVIQDAQQIAELAQSAGLQIAFEYHGNSLTDTEVAAKKLLESIEHSVVRSFWQPRRLGTLENDLFGISAIEPWLSDIHVFSWHPETAERLPLAQRSDDWQLYLEKLLQIPGDRYALIEFVQNNEPANFLRDAEVLKSWLRDLN